MRIQPLLLTVCFAALAAGCAVGPDFERPAAPDDAAYDNDAPNATITAKDKFGAKQDFVSGETLPGEWWKLFQSPALNAMITEALLHNPDLDAAKASLRSAEADLASGEGYLYPTVSGSFSGNRQKVSGASSGGSFPGSIYSLFNASLDVSYGIDLFGGTRRAVEDLEAQRDYQAYELEAARLSLTANVVTTAIREASLRGQIEETRVLIKEQENQLNIYQKQLAAGGVTKLVVLTQQTTLSQTRASLPPLESQLAAARHALSALMGQTPSHAPKATFDLASLHLPEKLPVSLPSRLVEQRPDIKAAEANLHAASAAIGVAIANRLPQLSLSADIGSVANQAENLFSPGGGIWAFGGSLTQTIFDAGTLEEKEEGAKAQFDQAAAIYRKTVIAAFQDVADSMRALEADAKALDSQSEAERAASESLKLSRMQYESGAISYLSILDAENAEQKARVALVQAQAARFADTAALFEALGGGWMSKDQTKDAPHD